MPRFRSGYSKTSATSSGAISENSVVFSASGGHTHDGSNSSLIDTTKYSVWDFPVNTIYTTNPRAIRQATHIEQFKSFIANVVNTSVLEPAGIVLGDNVVSANNIVAGSISSELIAANTIVAGNIAANTITTDLLATDAITSLNYSYISGSYSNAGTFFDLADGSITSAQFYIDNSGNAGFKGAISGGTIDIGGADTSSFHVDSSGNMWLGNASYASAPFRVSSGGSLVASAVSITGGTLDIGGADTSSFHVDSGGNMWLGNASYLSAPFRVSSGGALVATSATITGAINATSGTFSGTITASGTISGGTITGATITGSTFSTTGTNYVSISGSSIQLINNNSGGFSAEIYMNGLLGYGGRIRSDNLIEIRSDYSTDSWIRVGSASAETVIGYGSLSYIATFQAGLVGITGDLHVNTTSGGYGASWSTQQFYVSSSNGDAGIAIRAQNDAGTVQIRVGVSNTTAYFRNSSDGGWANVEAGTMYTNGTLVTSSRNIKENIAPVCDSVNAIDVLNAITPVTFNYRDKVLYGEDLNLGFIAEDVREILPDAVKTSNSIYYEDKIYIDQGAILTVTVQAVKELLAEIEELKRQLASFSN